MHIGLEKLIFDRSFCRRGGDKFFQFWGNENDDYQALGRT